MAELPKPGAATGLVYPQTGRSVYVMLGPCRACRAAGEGRRQSVPASTPVRVEDRSAALDRSIVPPVGYRLSAKNFERHRGKTLASHLMTRRMPDDALVATMSGQLNLGAPTHREPVDA
jgi:hypothetical protein